MQKLSVELLDKINEKMNVTHDIDNMFLSLVEEVGEVARELSRKQRNYRGEFDKEKLADELADIITRTAVIAEDNEINLDEAVVSKIEKIKKRFEIE